MENNFEWELVFITKIRRFRDKFFVRDVLFIALKIKGGKINRKIVYNKRNIGYLFIKQFKLDRK